MENKEYHNRQAEVIVDVTCDCCGNSCKVAEGIVDNEAREDYGEKYYDFEYMTLSANWGYHSGKDLETWNAQICEKCIDEKFSFIKFDKTKTRFI